MHGMGEIAVSSKKKPTINNNPYCCGEQTTWVDLGRWLQYFYCKKCKKEVKGNKPKDEDPPMWRPNSYIGGSLGMAWPVSSAGAAINYPLPKLKPTSLQPGEGVRTGVFDCAHYNNGDHYWPTFADHMSGRPCNCGDRAIDLHSILKGIP